MTRALSHRFPRVSRLAGLALVPLLVPAQDASSQIADQIVVYALDPQVGYKYKVRRFNRKLELLSEVYPGVFGAVLNQFSQLAVDAQGRTWMAYDPLGPTTLLRMTSDGVLLPPAQLGHNPVGVAVGRTGLVYAATRIPLSTPGPFYVVAPDGQVLRINDQSIQGFAGAYPYSIAITPQGELWLAGGTHGACGCAAGWGLANQLDPTNGDLLQALVFPDTVPGKTQGDGISDLAAAPDGTLIAKLALALARFDSTNGITNLYPLSTGGSTGQMRIDAQGDVWLLSPANEEGDYQKMLYRHDAVTGAVVEKIHLGGAIAGFALGATGEEVYAVTAALDFSRRLVRYNLVTGVMSSILLDPPDLLSTIAFGDPTGFIFANVVDQDGDNDGDGASNRQETLAGSNPFDPLSRPDGPKAYVSFLPGTNAIQLRIEDPDGLLHPTLGIDPATLALDAEGFGDVFPALLPFLRNITVDPTQTRADLEFGLLPIPLDLKIRLEVRVKDRTGAQAWDWQITPPGKA